MIGITGMGVYTPKNKISIDKICESLSIEERNKFGVKSVPHETELTATQMALAASSSAIKDANLTPSDLDLIINTQSSMHDYLIWQVSAEIQSKLHAWNAGFFDIYHGCAGFITGLVTAKNYLMGDDNIKTVLVNTSEKWDATVKNRFVGKLAFGEGGSAAIVKKNCDRNVILGHSMICRGDLNDVSRASIGTVNPPAQSYPDYYYYYNFTNLDKAREKMIPINIDMFLKVGEIAVKNSNLESTDIQHVIFPNVGFGLFEKVMNKFGVSLEKTNYSYISDTGDCGTVDTLLSYYRMLRDGKLHEGDHVLILAQGAGATWAAIVIKV